VRATQAARSRALGLALAGTAPERRIPRRHCSPLPPCDQLFHPQEGVLSVPRVPSRLIVSTCSRATLRTRRLQCFLGSPLLDDTAPRVASFPESMATSLITDRHVIHAFAASPWPFSLWSIVSRLFPRRAYHAPSKRCGRTTSENPAVRTVVGCFARLIIEPARPTRARPSTPSWTRKTARSRPPSALLVRLNPSPHFRHHREVAPLQSL